MLMLGLVLALVLRRRRRRELDELAERLADRHEAQKQGSHKARLQHPVIDLSRCIGCGTCVRACPEEGVLSIVHGQAVVVHGARCVGHGLCAEECPVGAVAVTVADLDTRKDIPVLDENFESPETPGLFLAGELTGFALIRTAIRHGTAVVNTIAARVSGQPSSNGLLDLCIVGAGPAGLAASLQAKALGLRFVTLEQSTELGGTVAKYPRRKLVMTQPVALPLYGRLKRTTYSKEELIELWLDVASKHDLPIRTGRTLTGVQARPDGSFAVQTAEGPVHARHVCLAMGRRGTPRQLGVPGEDLPKVAYSLLDAQAYTFRKLMVVGGGDSAIEAALGLADQPGNRVQLSYRKAAFSRLKARNQRRIDLAMQEGRIEVLFSSQVRHIDREAVILDVEGHTRRVPNDEVFVMIGGIPPFKLLESSGVRFDPAARPPSPSLTDQGTGLSRGLWVTLLLALAVFLWQLAFHGYYQASDVARVHSELYSLLRPTGSVGLACGIAAVVLIITNLAYILRRYLPPRWIPGSLRGWMTLHIATGLLAFLLVHIHAGMRPRETVGGRAYIAMLVLLATGALGRYLYAWVPRAANGRELKLDELRQRIEKEAAQWDQGEREFGTEVRQRIERLAVDTRWKGGLWRRLTALLTARSRLGKALRALRRSGAARGLSSAQLERLAALARQAFMHALFSTHYEELRALLSSWRYLHRWVAFFMFLLVIAHIVVALRYGSIAG